MTSAPTVSLYAARGESESFQVIVHAPWSALANVNATASDLTSASGAVISHSQLTFYREYYTHVTSSSLDLGGSNRPLPTGLYPDGLIPFLNPATGAPLTNATYVAAPFAVKAQQNQPLWIDINVPRTATPGNYTGTVTVTSQQGSAKVAVALTVWNFTMPQQSYLKSSFGFHGAQVGVKANEEVLTENRIMPFQINAPDSASLVSGFGLNATGLPFFSSVDSSTCTISAPPSVASFQAAKQAYAAGIETYEYAADEIDRCVPMISAGLKLWAQNVHAAGSKMLVTATPAPSLNNDGSGTGRAAVDIWVMMPKMLAAAPTQVSNVLQEGYEVWSYNCLVQDAYSPKWEMDFTPNNYRIQPGFLNQQFGLTGLLYYSVDMWTSDPWNNPNALVDGEFNYPGEGMLVYPGAPVGLTSVVPSIRLKWMRDGVDDFDYIQMLKNLGQGPWAMQVVNSVASSWSNWTQNPTALEAARIQLGNELSLLTENAPPPPPPALQAPSNPWPATGSTGAGTALTTQWSSVPNATQYQVYFGSSPQTLSLWATLNAPTVNYPIYNLSSGATYYWKIVAVDASGSTSGPVWSFTVN